MSSVSTNVPNSELHVSNLPIAPYILHIRNLENQEMCRSLELCTMVVSSFAIKFEISGRNISGKKIIKKLFFLMFIHINYQLV